MKIKKTKKVNVIEDYTINYENGVICNAQVINDKLIDYNFKSKYRLEPIENIDEVVKYHWSEHHEIAKCTTFETIEDLKNFKDFDKLFYIGGGSDGMIKDRNGKFLSSLLIFDDIFCSIYAKIGKPKKVDKVYDIILNHEWVKKIDKVKIPYYNAEKNKTHSLVIEILPSDEALNEILTKLKVKYVDDMVKLELLAMMGYDKRYKLNN